MPSRLFTRAVALGAALLTAGGLLASASPALAATHPSAKAVHAALRHRHTVLLPTGEAVSFDPAHPKDLRVHARTASGLGHTWRSFVAGGHTYVVPETAMPFLGTVLDRSLFDVTALAKAGKHPVFTVAVAKGQKAAVPGFTVKSRTKTSQRGTFSVKGAKQFGAALQRAAAATRGRTTATRVLFGASSIGATGAVRVVTPKYQQQTVIFTATGADGKPLPFGAIFYGNLDDSRRATNFAFIVDGEVRVSLPKGNYTLYAEDDEFTDTSADVRIVTQPALAVTGQKNQTVPIDFRTATATPSMTVPVAATPRDYAIVYDREWPTGGFGGFILGDPSLTVEIAPAPAPQIGTASLISILRSAPTSGAAELYTGVFEQDGAITADQHHTLAAGDFADVRERVYDTGAPNPAAFVEGVLLPQAGIGVGLGDLAPLPFERLDHLAAPASAFWQDSVITAATDLDPFDGEVDDGLRTYAPGSSTTANWLQQAVAPAVPTLTDADLAAGAPCLACRTSKELAVVTAPLVDSFGSGHYGYVYDDATGVLAAKITLYRNGQVVDTEPGSNAVDAAVPSGDATYKVVAESTPVLAGFGFGTVARTEWTFPSSASSGVAVPSERCLVGGKGTCRVLPLLKVVAPLPVDLHNTAPVGTSTFPLCVTGIQGADVGTTSATAQVSFDNGSTFTDVPLTAGADGCFTASLTNPASVAGKTAVLRITGTGSVGTSVIETVRNAYRVAG